jgi:hypothetical protein
LKELSILDLDFNLEATGFEIGEIDLRIESLSSAGDQQEDPADLLAIPAGPPVSRSGDLFILGKHRVFCGSALDQGSYAALMKEERAAMVFTDPPYNVAIEGNVSGLGAIRHRDFGMACGEMDQAEFTAFLTQACCCSPVTVPTVPSIFYLWIGAAWVSCSPRAGAYMPSSKMCACG